MADLDNRNGEMETENEDLIELVDENGETETFELLASFDLDEKHYLAVSEPIDEDADPESVEVFILRTETDAEGNDTYVSVDDEQEADAAFDYFMTLVDNEKAE